WNRTYTNDPNLAEASDTLPLGGIKNLILPLDAETAWVGGVVYAPGQTYLFRSDDGGKTWFNINLVLPENTAESELSLQDMVFITPTNGLLALRITSETPQTIVYITEDGGNTWVQSPAAFKGYGILETPSASEMIFYTADQFYVTKDAGVNIQQISPEIKFGDSIIDMSFANSQTGWVITASPSNERTLYKTTDGGATWTPLIP
ncbi:MAG: WD40/YVTN/BNR-like repeat-containing protein, partial [Chloroflexota bacterium]